MIDDAMKKQVLESLITEIETREVDGMEKEPGMPMEGDDPCPYCDESCAVDNPKCSMHALHAKPGPDKPKGSMKIKMGGNLKPKAERVY